jgi:hypothetical protein
MLNYTQLKDVVKNFLNDLFANEGHDAVLHIALNVGKGMLFAPQFDFDLFYWLRRLLDQGPGDINEETYESLRKIAFERSFQVYDILETVSSWLPEKDQELESLSPSNRCALLFIVDYTSNTLEQAKTKYKEKFYGQGLTTYPLFMPLKENKNSREDKLKKIVDWLLHPLIESVLNNEKQVDPNDDDDIDFDINRYTAAVLEEWAMALLGFDNEKSNPADSQAEEILHILLSQVIITLSKDRPRFRKIIDWFAKRRIEYRDFIDEYEVEKETKIQLMAGYKTARMLSGRLKELMVEYEKGDKK